MGVEGKRATAQDIAIYDRQPPDTREPSSSSKFHVLLQSGIILGKAGVLFAKQCNLGLQDFRLPPPIETTCLIPLH